MATCCPGLEGVLTEEIAQQAGTKCAPIRAKVHVTGGKPQQSLRCADNLFAYVGEVPVGPHRPDLAHLAASLATLPLGETLTACDLHPQLLHISASRSGKQSYSRFEAADAVLPSLCRAVGAQAGTADAHDVALRLDIAGERAALYVKLTGPTFRYRGMRDFSPAALRPTIAAALVRLTLPAPTDRFLDPCCGSGTVLCERAASPFASLCGGDIDETAVSVARANLAGADIHTWDARSLPLDGNSIDAVACNPPWGGQIALADEGAFYLALLGEMRRVCAPYARLALLTDRDEALRHAAQATGFACEAVATLSLHGKLAGLYRLAGEGK